MWTSGVRQEADLSAPLITIFALSFQRLGCIFDLSFFDLRIRDEMAAQVRRESREHLGPQLFESCFFLRDRSHPCGDIILGFSGCPQPEGSIGAAQMDQ